MKSIMELLEEEKSLVWDYNEKSALSEAEKAIEAERKILAEIDIYRKDFEEESERINDPYYALYGESEYTMTYLLVLDKMKNDLEIKKEDLKKNPEWTFLKEGIKRLEDSISDHNKNFRKYINGKNFNSAYYSLCEYNRHLSAEEIAEKIRDKRAEIKSALNF